MKNQFCFTVRIRSGRRTKPEVEVTWAGNENEMQIGKDCFSKPEVADWMRGMILKGINKAWGRSR